VFCPLAATFDEVASRRLRSENQDLAARQAGLADSRGSLGLRSAFDRLIVEGL
jgi:hypothetical protein